MQSVGSKASGHGSGGCLEAGFFFPRSRLDPKTGIPNEFSQQIKGPSRTLKAISSLLVRAAAGKRGEREQRQQREDKCRGLKEGKRRRIQQNVGRIGALGKCSPILNVVFKLLRIGFSFNANYWIFTFHLNLRCCYKLSTRALVPFEFITNYLGYLLFR